MMALLRKLTNRSGHRRAKAARTHAPKAPPLLVARSHTQGQGAKASKTVSPTAGSQRVQPREAGWLASKGPQPEKALRSEPRVGLTTGDPMRTGDCSGSVAIVHRPCSCRRSGARGI